MDRPADRSGDVLPNSCGVAAHHFDDVGAVGKIGQDGRRRGVIHVGAEGISCQDRCGHQRQVCAPRPAVETPTVGPDAWSPDSQRHIPAEVRAGGAPLMQAPAGTKAPISSPKSPVPRQGLPGWRATYSGCLCGLRRSGPPAADLRQGCRYWPGQAGGIRSGNYSGAERRSRKVEVRRTGLSAISQCSSAPRPGVARKQKRSRKARGAIMEKDSKFWHVTAAPPIAA